MVQIRLVRRCERQRQGLGVSIVGGRGAAKWRRRGASGPVCRLSARLDQLECTHCGSGLVRARVCVRMERRRGVGEACGHSRDMARRHPGTELREQGAVRLGGDGAALAGRRADCVRRECTHAAGGLVRQGVCADGVSPRCGRGMWGRGVGGDACRTELRLAEACGSLLVPRVRGRGAEARCQGWGSLDVECRRVANEEDASRI